ncbi:EutN/CcmL family microcompartment protein [Mucisphaera sp.]|uniref:EutN/CcmL family microcompartment protein n=1 Tax=Mucisphaera sp. TaxID=2913024 RepID=UPI003D0A2649
MQRAVVQGRATSTAKHPSLAGCKLLIAQMLGANLKPEGDPVIILDQHGAGLGDHVMLTSDGQGLRELLDSNQSPARWWTLGIIDHND